MAAGLGTVFIVRNKRAKRFIFRVKDNTLYATVPFYSSVKDIEKVLLDNSNRLKTLLQASKKQDKDVAIIDLNFKIDKPYFNFEIVEGSSNKFIINHIDNGAQLVAPYNTEFIDSNIQGWLVKVVEQALLVRAKKVLPPLVAELAQLNRLKIKQIKINLSKGRWGSCSSSGNINLSAFLVLLPSHLINAVILHELTHLTEMNHSAKFWNLLDKYSFGNAQVWNKELKSYKTSIF